MRVSVSLEFEEGDRADALYLLHFCNGVRVDLDHENMVAVLPLSYFEGRYITPAGDKPASYYQQHVEASVGLAPADGVENSETGLVGGA